MASARAFILIFLGVYFEVLEDPEDPLEPLEPLDPEEPEEEGEQPEIDDIPEGVKPVEEGASVPAVQEDEATIRRKMIGGLAAAAAVFVMIFAYLYMAHKSMISSWPASTAFYEMLGIQMDVPGEGLVFDRLKVVTEKERDTEHIKLEGHGHLCSRWCLCRSAG